MSLYFLMVCYYTLTMFSLYDPIAAYTLTTAEPLIDGYNLTSQSGNFQLGFFSPSTTSKKRYLGIWYNNIPVQTVVWVANRDSPLYDTSGVLKIDSSGNLVIVVNQTEELIWSTNTSKAVGSPMVEFLDSGNLVLRDLRYNDSRSYLWQSFDYPSDTLLPGMKQGWNLKTGKNWYLTSWKSIDDPSSGEYTYGLELGGSSEFVLWKGLDKYYRAGSWNGIQASGAPELQPTLKFTYEFVDNAEDKYFMYHIHDRLTKVRLVLTQTSTEAFVELVSWVDKTNSWIVQLQIPRDRCDAYALCGAYSTCDVSSIEVCQCLKGFKPKSLVDWDEFDWSLGCEREVPLQCGKGEGFKRYTEVKLPEAKGSWVNKSMHLEDCKAMCLNNCSCRAYSNSDITQGGSGCILWFIDPIDMRVLKGVKQDLYIRMAASELDEKVKRKGHLILIISIPSVLLLCAIALGIFCIWKKRSKKGDYEKDDLELLPYRDGDENDLPLYDLVTITIATNNFSEENKLGEGGFGPVYKGVLNGREIAVKRLSNNSIQGANEFKNEVTLISKIQHRNLVRILGYCIQQDEKLLIYEYMQNNSLDAFIFDGGEGRALNWQKRSEIILGIARGLLYLHHDSVLRIIHRDLKASNILLDGEMVAKISDFGMSRIFEGNQTEASTTRVVGTRGYMSPEYAVDGHFSVKSDVFSFGVLVLEIISGKRNRGFSHPDHELNLLGHTWRLWNEGKLLELADQSMNSHGFIEEISRCIHIGLLCVQKGVAQRPTMSSVLLMLSSETATLPQPQHPGFYIERSTITEEQSSHSDIEAHYSICADITVLEGR